MLLLEELVVIFGTKKLPLNFIGDNYEQRKQRCYYG